MSIRSRIKKLLEQEGLENVWLGEVEQHDPEQGPIIFLSYKYKGKKFEDEAANIVFGKKVDTFYITDFPNREYYTEEGFTESDKPVVKKIKEDDLVISFVDSEA